MSSDPNQRIRELEEALAASEQRNKQLLRALEHIPTAVQIYDEEGTTTYLNPSMVRMTGVPSAEVAIGKFNILTDPFSIETGIKVLYERAYRGEIVETDEFTIDMGRAAEDWGTSDHRVWFKMVLVPTFGVDGEVDGVFAIMFETTEKRRLARLLERSSRRDGIELIVGGVAHDFHNLLTTIMMNTELIVDDTTDAQALSLSDDVLGAADQAVFLSRQLLSYSGRQQKSIRTMDLSALTRDICQVFRQTVAQRGRMTVRLPDDTALAEVDSGQFKQVVMNLLTNGMQALRGEEGHLEVSLGARMLEASELEAFQFAEPPSPGHWHQLTIEDNGVGMPPEVLERIFEPYFTTKDDGHGLGLAALRGIVWGHGGGVAVQSVPNEGSRFIILWPVSAQALDPVELAPVASTVPADSQVFLADPSPYVRGSLRVLLQKAGVSVEEHGDGREAHDALFGKLDWPDLVVLEIMLTSLNGLDVLRAIRAHDTTLPVLLIGSHDEVGRVAAAEDPHTAFLAKPFSSRDFLRRAEALLTKNTPI